MCLTSAAEVNMNWAVSYKPALVGHQQRGSIVLNLATGQVSVVDSGLAQYITAHGVLMVLAWIVLLPVGIILARHKVLFNDKQSGNTAVWFHAHRLLQLLGSGLMVAGVIIAVVKFPDVERVDLYVPHKVIGWVVVALAGVQIAAAFIRPGPGAAWRGAWNVFHHNWGRVATVLAWINIYLGTALPFVNTTAWYVAVSVVLGTVVGAGVWLEAWAWLRCRANSKPASAAAAMAGGDTKGLEMRKGGPTSSLTGDTRLRDQAAVQV